MSDWTGDVIGRIDFETAYAIVLTGAGAAVPEPGSLFLLASGALMLGGSFLRPRQ